MPISEFWRDRRVLITGHTGFKGSWLALLLSALEADIAGLALPPPTSPSLYEFAEVGKEMRSVVADIRDPRPLADLIAEFDPEVVLHLAAQSVVASGYEEPVETFDVNVVGTARVLEGIRNAQSVKATVSVTTDKIYADLAVERAFNEEDPLGGHDPYSASKAAAELVTASYRDSFLLDGGMGVATARAGNVLGGGDWTPHQLVPEVITEFANGRVALLRHPGAVRPWQHVLDALSGYLHLAEALHQNPAEFSGAWNFGPESENVITVGEVADRLAKEWGSGSEWRGHETSFPRETSTLQISSTKARTQLGWRPRLDLDDTIASVVNWYRAYYEDRDITRQQVVEYLDRVS